VTAAISFDGVSKSYRGGEDAYRTLRNDLVWLLTMGRAQGDPRGTVSALSDVSFEIPVGQATALIGNNGAGKSTALKIASRITYPTSGRTVVRGRVGALIEVGTGLHPELTGRENIELYGRILGLSGREIRSRYDQIVDFATIPDAISQPVKQYSSGMQLRLGFAIAAHMEPDILVVDEAIAVGDAPFQYRCVERISQLVKEGRTLVFVSHNLMAVESLCERAILLSSGRVTHDGHTKEVIHDYIRQVHASLATDSRQPIGGQSIEIRDVTFHDARGRRVTTVQPGDPLTVRLHYHASSPIERPLINLGIGDPAMGVLTMASMLVDGQDSGVLLGEGTIDCTFASLPFKPRIYDVFGSMLAGDGLGKIIGWSRWARFQIDEDFAGKDGKNVVTRTMLSAPVMVPYRWDFGPQDAAGEIRDRDKHAELIES